MASRVEAPPGTVSLSDRYELIKGRALASGVQAVVRLVLDQRRRDAAAGLRTAGFVSGYPGSPLAGLDLELTRRGSLLQDLDIVHRPGLNEELAATAVAGSQLASLQPDQTVDGVAALWYGKAPGLDRASDALRHGNLMGAGATGGVVVCVGDDPQAKSSSVPSTSEPTLYSLGMPILSPADPQGILDLGLHAFALSRLSGLWVGLRIPATAADSTQTIELDPARVAPVMPDRTVDGAQFHHRVSAQLLGATLVELEASLYGPRLELARRYGAANRLNRVMMGSAHDVIGIAAAGPAYLAVRHALHRIGLADADLERLGVRLFQVSMPYPLEPSDVRAFAAGLREVLVVEDKRSFLETFVKEALYGDAATPSVVGKLDHVGRPLLPSTGELDVDVVAAVIAERLARLVEDPTLAAWRGRTRARRAAPLSLVRGAYFCSGCPHNTSVRVPTGAYVGSGSGCHGLAIQMDPRQVGNVVGRFQMGGEGAMWNGMSPFVATTHFFQNIGDGTLAHSGSLAIRAAVASGVNITYKLLVNSTVAMTGGQPIAGGRSLSDLVALLRAENVARIIITSDDPANRRYRDLPPSVPVWPRERLIEAQELLRTVPGVSVLVHDQECAAELRRRRTRARPATPRERVHVNTRLCEACGDCGVVSNCLSVRRVETPLGTKTQIHQESCNLDYSCLRGECPALVSVRPSRHHRSAPPTAPWPDGPLEDPVALTPHDHFTMRITGIGGTGVVTIAQIVAMGAHLEGRVVRTLDQTGIAQKGGAVVSDLRISDLADIETPRLGEGECDLYLGCDALVAADPKNLLITSPERTVAVVSTSEVPTGRQVADPTIACPPPAALRGAIDSRTRRDAGVWFDALHEARTRLGSDAFANVVLLGAAFQRGALPVGREALERAITMNAVAVAENLRAFELGRRLVASPPPAADASAPVPAPETPGVARITNRLTLVSDGALVREVRYRVADLVDYQDEAYAQRYADLVERALTAEARVGHPEGPFSRAVVTQLHRLMSYKDEYEVARLHLDPRERAEIASAFGPGARVTYHLAPPLARRAGRLRKIRVGRGADAAFHGLRAMHGLRGTRLDPFGWTRVRRGERARRDDYADLVGRLANELSPQTHDRAVALAELPDLVRGFGAVKDRSVERYLAATRDAVDAVPTPTY